MQSKICVWNQGIPFTIFWRRATSQHVVLVKVKRSRTGIFLNSAFSLFFKRQSKLLGGSANQWFRSKMSLYLVYETCLKLNGVSFFSHFLYQLHLNAFFTSPISFIIFMLRINFYNLGAIATSGYKLFKKRGQKDMQRGSECDDDKHSYLNHISVILAWQLTNSANSLDPRVLIDYSGEWFKCCKLEIP